MDKVQQKYQPIQFKWGFMGENSLNRYIGSFYGKIISSLGLLISIYLLIIMMIELFENKQFSLKKFDLVQNSDVYSKKTLDLQDHSFMPYIAIYKNNASITANEFDIFMKKDINQDQWQQIEIDYEKLQRYFSFSLSNVYFENSASQFIVQNFRQCNFQDFESKKVKINDPQNFLCPNTNKKLQDIYKISQTYDESIKRYVELSIFSCNQVIRNDCKSQNEIKQLMDSLYFEVYHIKEYSDLMNNQFDGMSPIQTKKHFSQELMVNYDKQLVQISEFIPNEVLIKDSIFSQQNTYKKYLFYQMTSNTGYIGSKYFENRNCSFDEVNYRQINFHLVWSMYYKVSDDQVIHIKEVQSFLEILGQFGGINKLIFSFVLLFTVKLNYSLMIGDFIQKMYFPFDKKNQFNFCDQVKHIWYFKPFLYFYSSHQSVKYQNLKLRLEDEMNSINILKRLQKISIMMTALMQQDERICQIADYNYQNHLKLVKSNEFVDHNAYEYIDKFGEDSHRKAKISFFKQIQYITQFHQNSDKSDSDDSQSIRNSNIQISNQSYSDGQKQINHIQNSKLKNCEVDSYLKKFDCDINHSKIVTILTENDDKKKSNILNDSQIQNNSNLNNIQINNQNHLLSQIIQLSDTQTFKQNICAHTNRQSYKDGVCKFCYLKQSKKSQNTNN